MGLLTSHRHIITIYGGKQEEMKKKHFHSSFFPYNFCIVTQFQPMTDIEHLEKENLSLKKEISALEKDLQENLYETILYKRWYENNKHHVPM